MTNITTHTIVKNEEKWIKPALLSVIKHVDTMLVWDTGSSDKTVEIIKSINSSKIKFKQCGKVNRRQLTDLRNDQIKATQTSWFIILDGDEVWPEKNIKKLLKAVKNAKPSTIALVNKTRNCIGDISHYLPDSKGKYQIGEWMGHLNIRAIKKLKGLKVVGMYPLEAYQLKGKSLQDQPKKLEFIDTWYLHLTHLKRSGFFHQLNVIDRIKKLKIFGTRIKLLQHEIPEVFKL